MCARRPYVGETQGISYVSVPTRIRGSRSPREGVLAFCRFLRGSRAVRGPSGRQRRRRRNAGVDGRRRRRTMIGRAGRLGSSNSRSLSGSHPLWRTCVAAAYAFQFRVLIIYYWVSLRERFGDESDVIPLSSESINRAHFRIASIIRVLRVENDATVGKMTSQGKFIFGKDSTCRL